MRLLQNRLRPAPEAACIHGRSTRSGPDVRAAFKRSTIMKLDALFWCSTLHIAANLPLLAVGC